MAVFQSLFPFLLLPFLIVSLLVQQSLAQLAPSETRILLQVQQLLEYPTVLQSWTNWTNFCYIPPTPSLTIVCSGNHVTEFTVIGNKSSPSITLKPARPNFVPSQQTLSHEFSIDLFFTVLTKLSSLKVLSLVSLGLWGPLPSKTNRFLSLEVLNISSNFISGAIPPEILLLTNLRSLVLADNLLHGAVPDLRNLTVLKELDLSSNLLGPNFPSLGENLVNVTLRNNIFRSRIPTELEYFRKLNYLDVSYNELFGQIPSTLFSLPTIQHLNLGGNKVTGVLPLNLTCSDGLEFVDLSHNLLIGKLPMCLRSNSSSRVVFYSWNCLFALWSNHQHPYSFCHQKALAVKPTEQNKKQVSNSKLGLSLGISGAILGGAGALGLIIFAVFRRVRAKSLERNTIWNSPSHKASPRLLNESRHLPPVIRFGIHGLPPYRVFYLEEIEEATNNFDRSNLVGEGSHQGELYKGRLRDGSKVVVRCFKLSQRRSLQSLLQHMELASKFRHRHLVSVLGHCIDTLQDYPNSVETIYLVFEYVSNGTTLRSHLADWRRQDVLKWPQRMAVALGVAKGIQFLHTGVAPGVTGNDLKIENILLDENLTAKISGYNLPMPSIVSSESNPSGEDCNENLGSDEHGEKQDIYQLGVVLLEVITGKHITSQNELDLQKLQLEQSLTEAPLSLRSVADPSIRGTYAYESLRTTAEITINCLSKDITKQPSIEDVLWNLQYSVQVQDGWTVSGENLGTHR